MQSKSKGARVADDIYHTDFGYINEKTSFLTHITDRTELILLKKMTT